MAEQPRLADLLSQYMKKVGMGDSKVAGRASERLPPELRLHRSSVRNWREGHSGSPRDWRPIAAIADVLRLDEAQASELLQAAGHPPIVEFLTKVSGENERRLFSPWARRRRQESVEAIVQLRMQAEDWKQLHQDCQAIHFKLFIVREAVLQGNVAFTLQSLNTSWRYECSRLIKRFVKLEHLPDRQVREHFTQASQDSEWLQLLQDNTERINSVVKECKTPEALQARLGEVTETLSRLERISSELLQFLDDQLLRTLKELDSEIEEGRTYLMY